MFTEEEDRDIENPVCIRCGNCIAHCPMKLEPIYMYLYVNKGDLAKMEQYHVADCFECGSCSFGCPGRLPLTQTFKVGKAMLLAKQAEEKARAEAEKANREAAAAAERGGNA